MVFEQVNLVDVIHSLEKQGFYDVALPFILIFTLVFAILQKIKIFGNNAKNFNAVIAMVIAFFTVRVGWVTAVINKFLPNVSLVVLFLIMLLIMLGIFGSKPEGLSGGYLAVGLIIAIGGVIWAFVSSMPNTSFTLPYWLRFTSTDMGYLIFIAIILITYAILKGKDDNSGKKFSFAESFGSDKLR